MTVYIPEKHTKQQVEQQCSSFADRLIQAIEIRNTTEPGWSTKADAPTSNDALQRVFARGIEHMKSIGL